MVGVTGSNPVRSTMKIVFAILLISFFRCDLKAQGDYLVKYNFYNYHIIDSLFEKRKNNYLIRNDYLYTNGDSISFYSLKKGSIRDSKKEIGKKPVHHALYTFPLVYRHLNVNAWKKPFGLAETETQIFNWEIQKDTRVIQGFTCKLAISGKLKAWFTEQIPISFGPYIYNGLSGLILRLEDYKSYWLYEATSIKENSLKIVLPNLPIQQCDNCETITNGVKKYYYF